MAPSTLLVTSVLLAYSLRLASCAPDNDNALDNGGQLLSHGAPTAPSFAPTSGSFAPTGGWMPFAERGLLSANNASSEVCYTLTAVDSYGDGWNGGSWTWTDDTGIQTTGTVEDTSASTELCATGCGFLYIDGEGSWPGEQSWYLVDSSTTTLASGSGSSGVDFLQMFCDGVAVDVSPTPEPTATRSGTCYTLTGMDSWGDGWNGAIWTWTDSNGVVVSTGTVSGSLDKWDLCSDSCNMISVECASSTSCFGAEIAWFVEDANNYTVASGTGYPASEAVGPDDDCAPPPTPVPTPVPSSSTAAPSATPVPTPAPSATPVPTVACAADCFGNSCDIWIGLNSAYTCESLEEDFGCSCVGCGCPTPAPTSTPLPTAAPTTPAPTTTVLPTPAPSVDTGDDGTCFTFYAVDSWGDGWNGGYWTWTDDDGTLTTGTPSSTDFVDTESTQMSTLCPGSGGCGTLYVDDEGAYAYEQSWLLYDSTGELLASGDGAAGVDITTEACLPASCDATCYDKSCDEWLAEDDNFDCEEVESWGCDCGGCSCGATTDDACEDSAEWYKAGKPHKGCDWIMDDPDDRCSDEGEDGTLASESCPGACNLCDATTTENDDDASTAPTPLCVDSTEWTNKGKSDKDCDWVATKPHKYCSKDDGGDWLALEACGEACGTCGCSDSDTWLYKGKSDKSCDYVAKKPSSRCDAEDDDGTTAGEACPMSCGNCGCQDSLTWLYKGKSGKDCDWVSKKPDKHCSKKDEDGTKAKNACYAACENCD